MDITKFLNSKDIREHLQAMDYSFDTVTRRLPGVAVP